jgi:hypothetical protein
MKFCTPSTTSTLTLLGREPEKAACAIENRCKHLAQVDWIEYQKVGDDHSYAQQLFA